MKFLSIIKKELLLFSILFLGAFLRFYNMNWDENMHLHPDERFLTMVGNAMKIPNSFSSYLNPATSTFNPNVVGFPFFVYGSFPLIINKLLALFTGNDSYNLFTIQGRFLSGLSDTLAILFVFLIADLLEKKYHFNTKVKYLASFLYAISVLPIQLSHFFTTDTFLNTFSLISVYFALRFLIKKSFLNIFLSASFFSFSVAAKVSGIYSLPLLLSLIFLNDITNFMKRIKKSLLKDIFIFIFLLITRCVLFLSVSYFFLRLTNPYYFNKSNFLDPTINNGFLQNLRELKSWEGNNSIFPPAIQWISKPRVLFSLINFSFFGLGIFYFLLFITGIINTLRKKQTIFLMILCWFVFFFLYQSSQFAQTMRYFIILYPFAAIFAAIGLSSLLKLRRPIAFIVTIFTLMWTLSFFSIYIHTNSRVQASAWLYKNLPDNSVILTEHWDDPLPLPIDRTTNKTFIIEQLPVFDPDTEIKWKKMNELLRKGDYLVLSSNRGWGSIPTVPARYPKMTKFYKDLFANKLEYKKIKEFTSYPSLRYLGIPLELNDDFAEESFTVYDHAKVTIFKKHE